jgi:hypothetical protein
MPTEVRLQCKSGFHDLFPRREEKTPQRKRSWNPDLNYKLTADCTSTQFLYYAGTIPLTGSPRSATHKYRSYIGQSSES